MMPASVQELQEIIHAQTCIQPAGKGTKTALVVSDGGAATVSASALSGILEYEPDEFTFTALAGTPVAEIEGVLAENNQYLPCDPPLSSAGATLGGTAAAGLNGPGRYRFGGLRDLLLGVQFFDGRGSLVRSGSRVVKNAAGFDLPKFMVGSLGGYGFLVELTFKVMPRPQAYATLLARYHSLESALAALVMVARQPFEIYALELVLIGGLPELMVRVGGAEGSLAERQARLRTVLVEAEIESLLGAQESALWQDLRDFRWLPADHSLVKIPLTPKRVLPLEVELESISAPRVYSVGGNLAWVAWSGEIEALDAILVKLGFGGLVVVGNNGKARLGMRSGESFARRIKQALDPDGKFVLI